MYLIRNGLSFEADILDRIRKKINDRSDNEFGITVKKRINIVIRQSESDIRSTRIILNVHVC